MSAWVSSSYMARRGVAAGRVGKTHHLTEAKQGSDQYVYGPYAAPVLTITPGDVVSAEARPDAFGGAITDRATANSAASPSRSHPRPRSTSISSSPGRFVWPRLETERFIMTIVLRPPRWRTRRASPTAN